MKKTISLASCGYKIISLIFNVVVLAVLIVLIIFNSQVPWYGFLMISIVCIFSAVGSYACFVHKIKINLIGNLLKVYAFKIFSIRITDIREIKVDVQNSVNSKKYCNIVFELQNGESVITSGYLSLLHPNKSVEITKEKIAIINELLFTDNK